ncbi:MAG TPA: quinone-dependent dihydroorotate dehydrogenase [Micromonosporaceae bacterium]|nr:quinone-dependent dihydroorotate dehydrogenase [Micromonosporaceae bacterium]
MLFERALRPALFRWEAEAAHDRTLRWLAAAARRPGLLATLAGRYATAAPVRVFGVDFPNPVGLAAGMDKDGLALAAWPALGFGFVEVGTVTWHPQPGNERPRLHRLVQDHAIVNRMGFNNRGARDLAARLTRVGAPLGISIGKSKITPLDRAVDDYLASYRALEHHGDYFAVNVSSPNTPDLRRLQDRGYLDELLGALCTGTKPILVKIAPELAEPAITELIEVCLARGAAGIIATNTIATPGGGLSGRPLTDRAREVVGLVRKLCDLPIIGVGGIMGVDDATRMFDAGADLVQLYTGFVYHGPALVRAIARSRRC